MDQKYFSKDNHFLPLFALCFNELHYLFFQPFVAENRRTSGFLSPVYVPLGAFEITMYLLCL